MPGFARTCRIPKNHATQTKQPGILFQTGRKPKPYPLLCAQSPANTGAFNPLPQLGQIRFRQAKTRTEGWNIQQLHHITYRHA